ncbi:hypothetical protein DVH05_028437 [Phytophthora capsici]|nr:hypothetical protein DVH05_028437 [Phytophthora capsici]
MLKSSGSAVVVQRPGDVVYLNSLVYRSVLLGFLSESPPSTKWGEIFGDVILLVQDREQSFKYATQLASGSERGSDRAWCGLLSAFGVMVGRVWNDDNYEEEKKIFLENFPKTGKMTKA